MGYSLSWLAIRGKAEAVRAELGLQATGRREEIPESPLDGAELLGGWYVVIADHGDRFMDEALLSRISTNCEAVACYVEEHVMCCASSSWVRGKKVWSATHDSQKGMDHLETDGDLPAALNQLQKEAAAKQKADGGAEAGVDHFFEIPLELAKAFAGFRHDEGLEDSSEPEFEILEAVAGRPAASRDGAKARRPWWMIW